VPQEPVVCDRDWFACWLVERDRAEQFVPVPDGNRALGRGS